MISREEVAKKLREAAEDIEEVSPYPAIVLNEITNIIAINEITSYQDFFNRLADLIDPTCGDVSELAKDGFTPVPVFKCSECGCQHISSGYVRYCPNCGARVVNVNEKS